MSKEKVQKSSFPQIVTSDRALKLAEQWVSNTSKVIEDEPTEEISEGRPLKLGLGAKVSRQPLRPRQFNDPVERKLYSNLQAAKRKAAETEERSNITSGETHEDGESDDEPESRTSAFAKKKAVPLMGHLTNKKRHK